MRENIYFFFHLQIKNVTLRYFLVVSADCHLEMEVLLKFDIFYINSEVIAIKFFGFCEFQSITLGSQMINCFNGYPLPINLLLVLSHMVYFELPFTSPLGICIKSGINETTE